MIEFIIKIFTGSEERAVSVQQKIQLLHHLLKTYQVLHMHTKQNRSHNASLPVIDVFFFFIIRYFLLPLYEHNQLELKAAILISSSALQGKKRQIIKSTVSPYNLIVLVLVLRVYSGLASGAERGA